MSKITENLQQTLRTVRAANLYRQPKTIHSVSINKSQTANHTQLNMAGREYLSFCSNDYLGLAGHSQIVKASQAALEEFGVGATGAHLISGHTRLHAELEEQVADWLGRERALVFSTGYMANMGVIDALKKCLPAPATIFSDQLNHASLIDGCRLSKAYVHAYPHADSGFVQQQHPERECLVVTDGVFSMDGDLAPLPELANIARQQGSWLMVDDAHGLGVIGDTGRGCCEYFGLSQQDVPVLMGTFGKAFGVAGAFIAGSSQLIEYLIQRARTYIYTTAQPPAMAAAATAALRIADEEAWRRQHLQALIRQFQQGAAEYGLNLLPSETPIQPIMVGSAAMVMAWSEALWAQGIHVIPIRPPTVPVGTARLRITFSAAHSSDDVQRLLTALAITKADIGFADETA